MYVYYVWVYVLYINMCIVYKYLSSHYLPLIHEGRGDVTAFYPPFSRGRGVSGSNPSSSLGEGRFTLDESPAHHSPHWWQKPPHEVPTAHQGQFRGSVSCLRILGHAARFRPRGAGIQSSNLLITSQPALAAELQTKSNPNHKTKFNPQTWTK